RDADDRRRRRRLRAEPPGQRGGAQASHGGDREGGLLAGPRCAARTRRVCAATEYCGDGVYNRESEGAKLTRSQMVDYLAAWCDKYPIVSIEDGMAENDWDGWKLLSDRLGEKGPPGGGGRVGT